MNELEQVLSRIQSVGHWYHRIEVAPGVLTPGVNDSQRVLEAMDLPADLSDKRVLDIGTRDGFFAFECERRGAEVVAIDYLPADQTGFQVARELLGSEVECVQENVYNLSRDRFGHFDLVLFLGVLYHLRDPMLALDTIWEVASDRVIVETQVIDDALQTGPDEVARLVDLDPRLASVPLMQFYPGTSLNDDATCVWAPNEACLKAMLEETGFTVDRQLRIGQRGFAFANRSDDPERSFWRSRDRAAGSMEAPALPLPPLAMREAVGPTDPPAFDNPTGEPVFPQVPSAAYESVFDFGCGCGRLARQMMQQQSPPRAYLGVDLHLPLVEWCREMLAPRAKGFEFVHHDVYYPAWNSGPGKPEVAPFPCERDSQTLVVAHSVFTHLVQEQAEYYLREVARVLARESWFVSTWFLFDKELYPMMQEFQNALYVNHADPSNAVVFDRSWLARAAKRNGLAIVAVEQPPARGFQWSITMSPHRRGIEPVELPRDDAPIEPRGMRAASRQPLL